MYVPSPPNKTKSFTFKFCPCVIAGIKEIAQRTIAHLNAILRVYFFP